MKSTKAVALFAGGMTTASTMDERKFIPLSLKRGISFRLVNLPLKEFDALILIQYHILFHVKKRYITAAEKKINLA